jgi:hypothetical protein
MHTRTVSYRMVCTIHTTSEMMLLLVLKIELRELGLLVLKKNNIMGSKKQPIDANMCVCMYSMFGMCSCNG